MNCAEALHKISLFHRQNFTKNTSLKEPVHRQQNAIVNEGDATEPAMRIIAAKQPITDLHFTAIYKAGRFQKRLLTNSAVKFFTLLKTKRIQQLASRIVQEVMNYAANFLRKQLSKVCEVR